MTGHETWSRRAVEELFAAHIAHYITGHTARCRRWAGIGPLLDWLEQAPGATWQERWDQTGERADDWLTALGAQGRVARTEAAVALQTLILEGVIRPSYAWLLHGTHHRLYENLRATVAQEAFRPIREATRQLGVSGATVQQAELVLSRIVVQTGKPLAAITAEDLQAYAAAVAATGRTVAGLRVAHQLLRSVGILSEPPLTAGAARRLHRLSVAERVARYSIASDEIRELLVRYLTERAAALDYASVTNLTIRLAKQFWRDIELHHPGISSLDLPRPVVEAWKRRQALLPDGRPRKNAGELFVVVRSFYLDLQQWAVEDPATWGRSACPSPIGAADTRGQSKEVLQRQARMHARTRTLAPLLPRLIAYCRQQRTFASELLARAEASAAGDSFVIGGQRFRRLPAVRIRGGGQFGVAPVAVLSLTSSNARPINCHDLEEQAFWTWAVVEVLRLTGLRVEELVELTHLSLHRTTLPDGQPVVLLQIAPSKRDRERVLPVCPELAHVLAVIVTRIQDATGQVPLVERFDGAEHTLSARLPYLFQRQWRYQGAVMSPASVAALLKRASTELGLQDKDGTPLYFTPHDFRRLFATEAVNRGLPIHIAAKLLGHLDLNTTRGYVAVYPVEVIRQYQVHLDQRRATRPPVEYREPTAAEWEEFGDHFRRRKLALGDCYRPYGTDCSHEHACIRCPMLRVDPQQVPRLLQIEGNTIELLDEARAQGWAEEVRGLEATLQHIQEKKAQVSWSREAAPLGQRREDDGGRSPRAETRSGAA